MEIIALVIHSLQAGGMERVMVELAYYFSKQKEVEVHIVLYGITREIFYKLPENISIYKPEFQFDPKKRTISTLKTIGFLRKQIKQINPDTVLSFGVYWNNLVLLSLLGTRIPVYVSDRSQPGKTLGKLQDLLRKKLYPKAAGVILQTQKAKDIYKTMITALQNVKVIGNPIREIVSKKTVERQNIILMVGRLIKTKNQDRLIRIFSELNNKNWKLVIVGYDHLKQKNSIILEQLIKELGLQNQVELAGKRDNVEDYYLKSKIFAFTSSSEGFPNVIGEAMSAGLPVVAYDCVAGPSDLIEDGKNGFLIPLFDDENFKEKLELLMNDESIRKEMGMNAKEGMKRFDKNVISQQFLEFILNY